MKAIIFDFGGCLYNHAAKKLTIGAEDTLTYYRGKYKLALVSLSDDVNKRIELLQMLGIDKMFDKVTVVNKNMGDKDIMHFMECCEEFDVSPEECYVVGDRIKKEIKLGNSLKMKTVWFKNQDSPFAVEMPVDDEEKPKYIISSLLELKRIVP